MARKQKPAEQAPIAGPQTRGEWITATMKAMQQPAPSPAAREEYRLLMDLEPWIAERNGDLALLARRGSAERYERQPTIYEAVKHHTAQIRKQLLGDAPTPIEALLVDVIIACRHDYYGLLLAYEGRSGRDGGLTLGEMPKWDQALESKETRYLRAIETLARVRRLLRLPGIQVNIATEGGQQVNVQG